MRALLWLSALLATTAVAEPAVSPRGQAWWHDIAMLADGRMEGRLTGTAGYRRAADYVIGRLHAEGLDPAGENGGYAQTVRFEEQVVDQTASRATLVAADGTTQPLAVGDAIILQPSGAPRPATVDAPLVFIGYGLRLPAQGYDDLKGLDLHGKIAVVISGGPDALPGPVKAANRSARAQFLAAAGAVGVVTISTPKQIEIPWARQKLLAAQSGMYLADPTLREMPDHYLPAMLDPAAAERLFAGSGHSFADLAALADAARPVPTFALPLRLRATVVATRRAVTAPNLVAVLPGSDPILKRDYVVLSAHLDHVGVGEPIAGDRIYNGAMDDASGVASVLDIAHRLKAGPRPKRSILFVLVAAEEKGLLGSHYFAARPTVPAGSIVADLNFDMPLPLWPLKTVMAQGEGESSLGAAARTVAAAQGLALSPDPLPNRNSFVRTDQFSFVKAGIPALAFKFGFMPGTDAFRIEHEWRATRYHAPSDDLAQPGVMKDEAIRLDDFVAALARAVADAPERPVWLSGSVFNPANRAR